MKRAGIIIVVIFSLLSGALKATHNRAGEILYKRIAPFSKVVGGVTVAVYNYSITVVKYTDHDNNFNDVADRCEDTVHFGDGEVGIAPRINTGVVGCNCGSLNGNLIGCGELIISEQDHMVKLNTYTISHTYPGPGNYMIRSFDPNRNDGVINMLNSVNVPFYIESFLVIDAFTGANSSPQFAFPPIDKACLGQCFEHNPGAWDPDPGDSLSFEITTSRGVGGNTVPGYFYPEGQYGINAVTGELRWCSPPQLGEYNLAFIVKEWRKNTNGQYQLRGYVLRDMQVIVKACPQTVPPVAVVPRDTCVEAGALYKGDIHVSDVDAGSVVISGGGGPFEGVPPFATLSNTEGSNKGFTSVMVWQTSCDHIRHLPYQATIKAQDHDSPVHQVSFSSFNITVVPPAIKGLTATPAGSAIRLDWKMPSCNPSINPITSFRIYRKNNCDTVVFTPCGPGPADMGFTLLASVGASTLFYIDNNKDAGLVVGQNYNYVVTAVYKDGSESHASAGVCSELRRNVPVLLNVDVRSTSDVDGEIFVRWTRPLTNTGNLDTTNTPGPYTFKLMHTPPGGTATAVFTSTANFLSQLDTAFVHKGVNTTVGTHNYYVEFLAADIEVGTSQGATSVFLKLTPSDNTIDLSWQYKTPWVNDSFAVYRKDPGTSTFTLLLSTSGTSYTDSNNVRNGYSYCYKVMSKGRYSDPNIFRPLINYSEESCAIPIDLTPPCVPTLTLTADCPEGYVRLDWTDVTKVCGKSGDVRNYILFHKKNINEEFIKVAEGNFVTYEFTELPEVSGCYAVQALDTNGNSSQLGPPFCIDNCPIFELPNVFTPNGDGVNDHFQAIRVRQIKEIELYVVDRWGNKVFETTDPYFKWDGVSSITKVNCSEGTYFYVCEVFEPRLKGIVKRTLKGTVHLAR
jgi:gliding motility-associated-like protein